jgi:hypothetical protein
MRTRRHLLKSLGASAILAPFVPFLPRRAEAAGAFPRRLLLVLTGNGSVPDAFWPAGAERDWRFPPGSITEPLAPFRDKLTFPRNLTRVRNGPGGHESAIVCLWTASTRNPGVPYGGYARSASVDQIIARALPQETAFRSLELGVQHDGPGSNPKLLSVMSYAGNDQPIQPESSPYRMFDRLMLGSAGAPTGMRPEDLERVRASKSSVLDLVRHELRGLATRIDRDDRVKLEQHLEALGAVEKRLQHAAPTPGKACPSPGVRTGIDLKANESFPELLKLQTSLAVAALACDRTRVATLQWSRAYSQVRHTWVNVTTDHHTLSHATTPEATQQKQAIDRWFMERMAELLAQLDGIREGDGTLLDNTMLVYANELTEGAPHSVEPPLTFVAGGCGGRLRPGRLLDLGGAYDFSQLLVTACHAMGATGVEQIGDLGKEGDLAPLLAGA